MPEAPSSNTYFPLITVAAMVECLLRISLQINCTTCIHTIHSAIARWPKFFSPVKFNWTLMCAHTNQPTIPCIQTQVIVHKFVLGPHVCIGGGYGMRLVSDCLTASKRSSNCTLSLRSLLSSSLCVGHCVCCRCVHSTGSRL